MASSGSSAVYFAEYRKGEINELRYALQETFAKRNEIKQKAIVKKIIASMTLGMDVSPLFMDMVMASNTKDLVQKKLVYLYLTYYAAEQSKLALLAINTLQKDCRDDSPMVRGLALRSMTYLKIPSLIEHIIQPLKNGLLDVSPYVRKTAAISCAKLFRVSPDVIKDSSFLNRLYELIRDKDPQVIVNALMALGEILKDEGGVALNQKIVAHLLENIRHFNDWAQCYLLELLLNYDPPQEEVFGIMNLLDDRLKHPNAGVVLAVVKLFLKYTQNIPEVHVQVYLRVKEPLITLLAATTPELELVLLAHIKVLAERSDTAFQDQYKRFYCRQSDALFIKLIKLDLLLIMANEVSMHDIASELTQYAMDTSAEVSKKAISMLGRVAIRLPSSVSHVLNDLLTLLEVGASNVANTTMEALKDILRKFPDYATNVIAEVPKCMANLSTPDAKASAVWMLGEFGERLEDSPYTLEDIVETYNDESPVVRVQLVSAAAKLFFKRPAEMGDILKRTLALGCADSAFPDVHDRALYLTRLISRDSQLAQKLLLAPTEAITLFDEDILPAIKDHVFEEFNTLSVLYGVPIEQWKKLNVDTTQEPDDEEETPMKNPDLSPGQLAAASRPTYTPPPQNSSSPAVQPASPASKPLTLADVARGGGSNPSLAGLNLSTPASPGAHSTADISVALKANPALNSKTFQTMWQTLPLSETVTSQVNISTQDPKVVERTLKSHSMASVATGLVKNIMKLFLYAQEEGSDEYILMEYVADMASKKLVVNFKSKNASLAKRVALTFKAAFVTSLDA